MAIQHFDLLLDKLMERDMPEAVQSFLGQRNTLEFLARLLGASEFLWEDYLRMQFENLVPILQEFKKDEPLRGKKNFGSELEHVIELDAPLEDQKRALNEYKDREMFRIDMQHLLSTRRDMAAFSEALSDLAEVVLERSFQACYGHLVKKYGAPALADASACPYTVCGLGKFGGREMGYASDIEILFVYKGAGRTRGKQPADNGDFYEELCRTALDFVEAKAEGIFQIDMRLRPHGRAGALANPDRPVDGILQPLRGGGTVRAAGPDQIEVGGGRRGPGAVDRGASRPLCLWSPALGSENGPPSPKEADDGTGQARSGQCQIRAGRGHRYRICSSIPSGHERASASTDPRHLDDQGP